MLPSLQGLYLRGCEPCTMVNLDEQTEVEAKCAWCQGPLFMRFPSDDPDTFLEIELTDPRLPTLVEEAERPGGSDEELRQWASPSAILMGDGKRYHRRCLVTYYKKEEENVEEERKLRESGTLNKSGQPWQNRSLNAFDHCPGAVDRRTMAQQNQSIGHFPPWYTEVPTGPDVRDIQRDMDGNAYNTGRAAFRGPLNQLTALERNRYEEAKVAVARLKQESTMEWRMLQAQGRLDLVEPRAKARAEELEGAKAKEYVAAERQRMDEMQRWKLEQAQVLHQSALDARDAAEKRMQEALKTHDQEHEKWMEEFRKTRDERVEVEAKQKEAQKRKKEADAKLQKTERALDTERQQVVAVKMELARAHDETKERTVELEQYQKEAREEREAHIALLQEHNAERQEHNALLQKHAEVLETNKEQKEKILASEKENNAALNALKAAEAKEKQLQGLLDAAMSKAKDLKAQRDSEREVLEVRMKQLREAQDALLSDEKQCEDPPKPSTSVVDEVMAKRAAAGFLKADKEQEKEEESDTDLDDDLPEPSELFKDVDFQRPSSSPQEVDPINDYIVETLVNAIDAGSSLELKFSNDPRYKIATLLLRLLPSGAQTQTVGLVMLEELDLNLVLILKALGTNIDDKPNDELPPFALQDLLVQHFKTILSKDARGVVTQRINAMPTNPQADVAKAPHTIAISLGRGIVEEDGTITFVTHSIQCPMSFDLMSEPYRSYVMVGATSAPRAFPWWYTLTAFVMATIRDTKLHWWFYIRAPEYFGGYWYEFEMEAVPDKAVIPMLWDYRHAGKRVNADFIMRQALGEDKDRFLVFAWYRNAEQEEQESNELAKKPRKDDAPSPAGSASPSPPPLEENTDDEGDASTSSAPLSKKVEKEKQRKKQYKERKKQRDQEKKASLTRNLEEATQKAADASLKVDKARVRADAFETLLHPPPGQPGPADPDKMMEDYKQALQELKNAKNVLSMWENEVKHFKIQLGTSRDDPEVAGYRDATSARAQTKQEAENALQSIKMGLEGETDPERIAMFKELQDKYEAQLEFANTNPSELKHLFAQAKALADAEKGEKEMDYKEAEDALRAVVGNEEAKQALLAMAPEKADDPDVQTLVKFLKGDLTLSETEEEQAKATEERSARENSLLPPPKLPKDEEPVTVANAERRAREKADQAAYELMKEEEDDEKELQRKMKKRNKRTEQQIDEVEKTIHELTGHFAQLEQNYWATPKEKEAVRQAIREQQNMVAKAREKAKHELRKLRARQASKTS